MNGFYCIIFKLNKQFDQYSIYFINQHFSLEYEIKNIGWYCKIKYWLINNNDIQNKWDVRVIYGFQSLYFIK